MMNQMMMNVHNVLTGLIVKIAILLAKSVSIYIKINLKITLFRVTEFMIYCFKVLRMRFELQLVLVEKFL